MIASFVPTRHCVLRAKVYPVFHLYFFHLCFQTTLDMSYFGHTTLLNMLEELIVLFCTDAALLPVHMLLNFQSYPNL